MTVFCTARLTAAEGGRAIGRLPRGGAPTAPRPPQKAPAVPPPPRRPAMLCSGPWAATLVLLAFLPAARCPPEDLSLPLTGGRPQRPPVSIRKNNRAAFGRVGARGGGGRQRASGYGRRLAVLPAWGGCSTTATNLPKPPGSSISLDASARARHPPFSHDNGATPPSRQRSLTGASARSAMPPTSTPLPPLSLAAPFAFPNAQQWALWAPIAERQAEIFGRAASAGQECEQDSGGRLRSRTPKRRTSRVGGTAGAFCGERGAVGAAPRGRRPTARPPSTAVNPAVYTEDYATAADHAAIYATPPTRPTGRTKEIAVSPACENTSASCS